MSDTFPMKDDATCLTSSIDLDEFTFPFLELPYLVKLKIYPYFDLSARHALRSVEGMEEIEMEVKYRYGRIEIDVKEDQVVIQCRNKGSKDFSFLEIPHSGIEKELESIGRNTQFDKVAYYSIPSDDRTIFNSLKFLETKSIFVNDPRFNDCELQSIIQGKDEIMSDESAVSETGLMWIYEQMRDRRMDVRDVWLKIPERERWTFLGKFGTVDRESLSFSLTNLDEQIDGFSDDEECAHIYARRFHIYVFKRDYENNTNCRTLVSFVCTEDGDAVIIR